ncbi:HNH endonuclease signature motif containing protein [Cellulomonas sp. PS-H5]|uniref:HNH endonuclease signature motif containing protein n=1 Tax=Cellulomonas sp. PS-H5 TaxID=2820400 RepID=UPI001C4F50AE|nr:HNH endonuclease signature motif containing protein [Cellulomonas sp. PS-H5]MBW0253064.1 HNH endonuclease [Cellulomonas sp. PS-H5]
MASDLQGHPDGDPVAAGVLPVYGPDGTCLTDFGPDPVVAAGGAPRTGEQRQVEAIRSCEPGPVLDAWLRGLDPDVLPSGVLVEVIAAQTRIESYQHARTLGLIAELASREEMSPEWSPLAGAPPTQACVAGDELAMRLGWPLVTATKTVHRALVLDGMLGATREALEVGHLDPAKAQVLTAGLADLSFQVAHAVEDAVLPDAHQCSVAELRQRVAREIRLVDPEGAAARRERARCTRRVSHPRPQPDGMASMWLVLDAADALRVDGVLTHAAKTAKALGDDRTLDQLRADGLRDLVVGDVPASDGPAFEVHLSPGLAVPPEPKRSWNGATSTDRDGVVLTRAVEPIPIATLTPLDDTATATDAARGVQHPAPPPGVACAPPGIATDTDVDLDAKVESATQVETDAGVRTASVPARHGCTRCSGRPGAEVRIAIPAATLLGLDDQPAHLDGHGPIDAVQARALAIGGVWQRVVTDPLTARVLDVGRERYRPPAALAELIRVRDKTCAAPGCRVPACGCELDHTQEFHPRPGGDPDAPLGRTDADNLGPVCHRHHRLKTDGGFRLRQISPGLFEWITPTGHRYLTRPGTGQTHDATADPYDAPPPF